MLVIAGMLLLALVGSLGVVQWNFQQDLNTRLEKDLSRAKTSLFSRENRRFDLLSILAHNLEVNPSLRLVINRTDEATLSSFLEEVRNESGVEFVLLTDYQGHPMASTLFGKQAVDFESVRMSLEGEETDDFWDFQESIYEVYTVPLVVGDVVDGSLSMATKLDDRALKQFSDEVGMDVALISQGKVRASTVDLKSLEPSTLQKPTELFLDGRTFRTTVVGLPGDASPTAVLMADLTPYQALLKQTRTQIAIIGVLIFGLALIFSFPLVDRATNSSVLLATVVETVGDGLVQLDAEGNVIMMNPAAQDLLGIESENLLGRPFQKRVKVMPWPGDLGDGFRLEDAEVTTENSHFPAALVATKFSAESGQQGTVIAFRDISAVKENERQLRESARAKAEFLAHMSHEIRTPLNGVLGMNALLIESQLSPSQARYANIIDSSGQALLHVINDILDLSKLEAGAYEVEEIEFHLVATIESVAGLLATRAKDQELDLVLDLSLALPATVVGDPNRIRQILLNLIGNALKFTESGHVAVKVEERGERIRFEITDTGIGISAEDQKKLFAAFSQATTSTSRIYGGTGLGLSISQKLVSLMGGDIGLESVAGEGSTFWFELPLPAVSESVPRELGKVTVSLRIQNQIREAYLRNLLKFHGLCLEEAGKILVADQLLQQDSPENTILLARPGQEREGWYSCPVPIPQERLIKVLSDCIAGIPPVADTMTKTELGREVHPDSPLILVVDDNSINREVADASLRQLGFRSSTASGGEEALKLLAQLPVAAILMDCEMPGMDGFETTRRVRENHPELPIVALTAGVLPEQRESIAESGMNETILKPFKLDRLVQVLSSLGVVPLHPVACPDIPDGSDSQDVLDMEKLAFLAGLRPDAPDFVQGLIEGYLVELPEVLSSVSEAFSEGDLDLVRGIAHKQKGSSGNLGLRTLHQAAKTLEEEVSQINLELFLEACKKARSVLEDYLSTRDKTTP